MTILSLRFLSENSRNGSDKIVGGPSAQKAQPRYMSKRPLLTIKIPGRPEKEEPCRLVSCFSPFSDDESTCSELSPCEEKVDVAEKAEIEVEDTVKQQPRRSSGFKFNWANHCRRFSSQIVINNHSSPQKQIEGRRRSSLAAVTQVSLKSRQNDRSKTFGRVSLEVFEPWHSRSNTN